MGREGEIRERLEAATGVGHAHSRFTEALRAFDALHGETE